MFIYALYDRVARMTHAPFNADNDALAKRMISVDLLDPQTPMRKVASDLELICLCALNVVEGLAYPANSGLSDTERRVVATVSELLSALEIASSATQPVRAAS